jgi:large subunit ribosomal protein L18
MSTQVHKVTSQKQKIRFKRKKRIRARLEGTAERPRLSVFRSNRHVSVQIVDDVKGHTLAAASTLEGELQTNAGGVEAAKSLGALIAKRALAKNISQVVFDRSGYLYHGRIQAVADAAREGGLKF